MKFVKKDAIRDSGYVKKCYDSYMRSVDRGLLTLVNGHYLNFEITQGKRKQLGRRR